MNRKLVGILALGVWGCNGVTEAPTEVRAIEQALTVCKTATSTYSNTAFAAQTGTFTAEYDATPNAKPIDSVVGLSKGPQTAHTGFATQTRFNSSGNIDARNGGAYAAISTISYSAGASYHFRVVVNVAAHTYSAYVTPAGGTEKTIGLGFAFRTEQASVSKLDSWGTIAGTGSAQVCGVTVTPGDPTLHTMTVRPVADTFVKDSAASTNFGTQSTLEVKTSSSNTRWGYLRFDLSGLTNISGAKLLVNGRRSDTVAGAITTQVFAVSNTSWSETATTWSNKPALGAVLGSLDVLDGQERYYEVDVTQYLQSEKSAGRNLVTLGLKALTSSSAFAWFYSRETPYAGATLPPGLVITTTDAPVRAPALNDPIDPFLAGPATGALYQIPVVIVRYFPTQNGTTLAPVAGADSIFGSNYPLSSLVDRTRQYDVQNKFMLEEGSRFRGYKTPGAPPSLGYRVVKVITFYEEIPEGVLLGDSGHRLPDYAGIMNRIDARSFVEGQGVKEFWIWGYHYGHFQINESKMSSPLTGDISNSWHHSLDNPPVFNKTYLIYNYNFTRTAAEATHNHGHQHEAQLSFMANRQDGTSTLFWNQFVGNNGNTWATGRCGDTHHPVNALSDYDYLDFTNTVTSDIEDWKPQGGTQLSMNASHWDAIPYAWPNGAVPSQKTECHWYTYWRQAFPGRGNTIQDAAGQYMTNWWRFVGDWDGAVTGNVGLHAPTPAAP
jgi:hypothetical protein